MRRSKYLSSSVMTWSRISRRQLPTQRFRGSILPGRSDARPLRLQTRRPQERDDSGIEFRVAVQAHITVWANFRESFAQLLDDPLRTRMSSNVEM